ncbi:hypothetical protein ACN28E_40225 [Archangium lansingense]|uniref:hypothetical protein n=1 Tax=Archangium lansingense TaxID=2995310 RepID=UPI003B7C8A67
MLHLLSKTFLILLSSLLLSACQTTLTVTLVGMADYHSRAVPIYSEGELGQGGVARAMAYLRAAWARREEGVRRFVGDEVSNRVI